MANQRHLKNKDMELSYLQERVLDAMYALTFTDMVERGAGEFTGSVYFRGNAIAILIGGAWSTFRKREVDKLIALGWMEKRSIAATGWCYCLTETGWQTLFSRVRRATGHAIAIWHDQAEGQQELFGGAF